MSQRNVFLVRTFAVLFLVLSLQCVVRADDFGMIVHNIEKHYNAKQKKIRFMGLAGFAVKMIHPAGVKNFKVAVFDEQDFAAGERDREFERAVAGSLSSKWKPIVRANDRGSGNRTYVYTHQTSNDIEMLTVTISPRLAVVAQAKVNPEAMAKFIDKPEIMGISLGGGGGSIGLPSIFDPSSSVYSAGTSGSSSRGTWTGSGDRDTSLDSLNGAVSSSSSGESRSRPALRRAGEGAEFDPVGIDPRDATKTEADKDAIRLEARLVNLNVKATDRSGSSISDLKKEDFKVFEDGVEQGIFYFEPVNAPINLVLLLDLSGSTRDSRRVMIETAKKFIDSLGPTDRVAAAAFTRRFIVASDFTSDKRVLKQAVEKMNHISGGTAFYDAMWSTFDLLDRLKDSRKAIVVLTDGVDNSLLDRGFEDTNHTFEQLLARVAEEDATIYPIYLNPEEARLKKDLDDPNMAIRRERIEQRLKPNLIAHRQIEQLAEESAGSVFVAEAESDLDNVYQRVAAELRLMYTVAYAPKDNAHDGKFKKINVTVNREAVVVKTRRGYIAK
jgi:VWFA-related protein